MLKFKSKKDWLYFVGLVLLAIGYLFFAYNRTLKESIGGDIHVFWQAGVNFISGADLYFQPPGMRDFLYPPFAALFFSLIAILPFKVATYLFFVLNGGLWFYSFYLLRKIVEVVYPSIGLSQLKKLLWFVFFLSFKFYWNNIMTIQVNEIVYIFTLLGIYEYLIHRENRAIFYLAIATSIKIVPIFFFFWMVIRSSSFKFFAKCVLAGFVCIALPFILRGPTQGWIDIATFYAGFLQKFIAGKVYASYANQTWATFIHHLFAHGFGDRGLSFQLVELPTRTVKLMTILGNISFILLILITTFIARIKKYPMSLLEIAGYFLAAHLVSGITWKAHLVTISFAYLALLLPLDITSKVLAKVRYFIIGLAVVLSLTGKMIVGKLGMLYVGGYGAFVIIMVLMLIFFSILIWKKNIYLKYS